MDATNIKQPTAISVFDSDAELIWSPMLTCGPFFFTFRMRTQSLSPPIITYLRDMLENYEDLVCLWDMCKYGNQIHEFANLVTEYS